MTYQEFRLQLRRALSRLPQEPARRAFDFLVDPNNLQNVALWISAVSAAAMAVAYALAFRYFESAARNYLSAERGYWAFVVTPVAFALAWWVVRRFAPEAAGSGIPQVMAANETPYEGEGRAKVDTLLSLRTMFVKIVSSLLAVVGGGAIGREGPTLQISASLFHFFGAQVRRVLPSTSEQTWIVAGAAAGLAAAFNTPLGGIVYAIEELGAVHFHRVRTALLSAVIIAGLVAQWWIGNYLYLGFPALQDIGFPFLPWALAVGLITGLLGGVFGRLLYILASLRAGLTGWRKPLLVTLACGLVMAGLMQLSTHASGPGLELMQGLLFHGEKAGPLQVAIRFVATMVSYLSGAAGGIFAPSLAVGAAVGSWLTELLGTQHPHLMVLLGMIGFLTGVTRTPFTSFILVLEMTDRHSALFPMMMTAVAAQSAAHFIDETGFYEHMKARYMQAPTLQNRSDS